MKKSTTFDCIKSSYFVQQHSTSCAFDSSDSWVILTPIEQSIKRKIEAVGTPLKDWDIKINYGIKTGYNPAFIIDTDKRTEILNNCLDDDERKRTEELIRPILRGRDIKRYGYDWDDLWLINTHNGVKGRIPRIRIEDYPAIKAHLDQYWENISKRADKGDTPYNLRNCAYLEDFSKPKITYREISSEMNACLIESGWIINNKLYMITGNHLEHLLNFLNSKLFNAIIMSSANLTGGKGFDFIKNIKVPLIHQCDLTFENELSTNMTLYKLYGLDNDEVNFIENI